MHYLLDSWHLLKLTRIGHKLDVHGHSGHRQDTVGPAFYNPTYGSTKANRGNAANFSHDIVPRRVFDLDNSLPGPGHYDYDSELVKKQNFNGKHGIQAL